MRTHGYCESSKYSVDFIICLVLTACLEKTKLRSEFTYDQYLTFLSNFE